MFPRDRDLIEVSLVKLDHVMDVLSMAGMSFHSRGEALDFVLVLFISNYLTHRELERTREKSRQENKVKPF